MVNPFDYVKECLQLELTRQNRKSVELQLDLADVSEDIMDLETALRTVSELEKKIDNQEH